MSTKERIQAVLDTVPDEDLDELYQVVRDFASAHNGKHEPGIMEKLRSIKKFQGPADFAENLDQYTSGEKRVEDHLPFVAKELDDAPKQMVADEAREREALDWAEGTVQLAMKE